MQLNRGLMLSKKTYVCQPKALVPHVPVLPAGVKEGGWDLTHDDFEDYCHGMPFMVNSVLKTLPWIFQKFQSWYFEACSKGIPYIQGKLPGELFGQPSCDINVSFEDIHALYHLDRMDATLIAVWCL